MAAILDFRLEHFKLCLIYKLSKYFLQCFESNGISAQEVQIFSFFFFLILALVTILIVHYSGTFLAILVTFL